MKKLFIIIFLCLTAAPAFAATSATLFMDENGNYGIGSSAPTQKLDINGTVKATSFSGDGAALTNLGTATGWTKSGEDVYASGTGNMGINSAAPTAQLNVKNNASVPFQITNATAGDYVTVTSAGNVGIGTTSPATGKLVVAGNIDLPRYDAWRYITNSSINGGLRLGTGNATGVYMDGIEISSGGGYVKLNHNTIVTGGFYVTGNVGIGTTTPQAMLHINDGGTTTYGTTAQPSLVLGLDSAGKFGVLKFWGTTSGKYGLIQETTSNFHLDSVGGGLYLNYYTGNKLHFGPGANGNGMGVWDTGSGNVGIGTYTPVARLDVGVSTTGPALMISSNNGNSTHGDYVTVTSTGNVGIGTTVPAAQFDVQGDAFPVGRFNRRSSSTGGAFETLEGVASGFYLKTTSTGDMTNGFGGGFVFGINDSALTSENNYIARLYARRDGADGAGALQFWIGDGGNTPGMIIRSSGNVGIGTTAPAGKMQIVGQYSSKTKVIDGASGTWQVDWDNGNVQRVVLAAGVNNVTFADPVDGGRYVLIIKQPAAGGPSTLSFGATPLAWAGGSAPVLSTAADYIDIFSFIYDAAEGKYLGGGPALGVR